jgi:hypothetical protein
LSVLVVIEIPGGSTALDDALVEAWHLTGSPPEGNRLRLSGPMEGGWRVVSLWDSAQQFEAFLGARLHLTLDEVGDDQPSVTVWEIEKVHAFE